MTGTAPKTWALPRFWVSILSYKKQPVKKIGGRMLGLAWLKFAVAPLNVVACPATLFCELALLVSKHAKNASRTLVWIEKAKMML